MLSGTLLSPAFLEQPAWAHDPPVILPTRLDFNASQAPKNCNDPEGFKSILNAWVPATVFADDAQRQLIVRISTNATGGKQVDVSLVDALGAVLAERRASHSVKTECYFALSRAARDAAEILGAFEPPPPKEPMTCPAAPSCPTCPPIMPTSTGSTLRVTPPTLQISPPAPRFFVGIGAFVGSGMYSELGGGPLMLLGFVPFGHVPQLHLEFEGGWTSQWIDSIRMQAIPLVGSGCWVRGAVRFCFGFATTNVFSNQLSNHEVRLFGPNVRLGTELFHGRYYSIRADVFGRVVLAQHTFGSASGTLNGAPPLSGGVAVIASRSFD